MSILILCSFIFSLISILVLRGLTHISSVIILRVRYILGAIFSFVLLLNFGCLEIGNIKWLLAITLASVLFSYIYNKYLITILHTKDSSVYTILSVLSVIPLAFWSCILLNDKLTLKSLVVLLGLIVSFIIINIEVKDLRVILNHYILLLILLEGLFLALDKIAIEYSNVLTYNFIWYVIMLIVSNIEFKSNCELSKLKFKDIYFILMNTVFDFISSFILFYIISKYTDGNMMIAISRLLVNISIPIASLIISVK